MTKAFAWSPSALKSYETCPLKYYHQSIAKTFKDTTSEAGDYGQDAHRAIHLRIKDGEAMPPNMRQYQGFVDSFVARPGKTYSELKMAFNRSYRPTGYFDSDVWVRTQMDAGKIVGAHAAIIDWKFGRVDEAWETQSLIMAMATFCLLEEIKTVKSLFVWWKLAKNGVPPVSDETYTRESVWQKWLTLMPRVENMERAVQLTDFPARPNGLCAQYCPVTTCPHNGRR